MSRDKTHAKVAYDWYGSWTTLYNMFGDALLCFHLEGTDNELIESYDGQTSLQAQTHKKIGFIPRHIYTKQSKWYDYVRQKYGLPLDSRHLYTKTDWEFFAMAVSSKAVRHEILRSVANWVNETSTDLPFTDLHETEGDGGWPGPRFFARPVVGGHFSFLALEKACNGKAMDGLRFLDHEDADEDIPGAPGVPIGETPPICEGELECLDPAPPIPEPPVVAPPAAEPPTVTHPVPETPTVAPPVAETPTVAPTVSETPTLAPPVAEPPTETPPIAEPEPTGSVLPFPDPFVDDKPDDEGLFEGDESWPDEEPYQDDGSQVKLGFEQVPL